MHEIIKAEIRKDLLSAPKIAVFISLLILQFLIALIRFMQAVPIRSFPMRVNMLYLRKVKSS